MARGSYNGGSTVLGRGKSWSFDPEFDYQERVNTNARKPNRAKKVKPQSTAITVAGHVIGKKVLRKHKLAKNGNVDRDEVLSGLNRQLPKKPEDRRNALKQLVEIGILLKTGVINVGHPDVSIFLKRRKKSKIGRV